jgi:hypothetical protein
MGDKAEWETPELDRLGDSGSIQSGELEFITEQFGTGRPLSVPSGPTGPQ